MIAQNLQHLMHLNISWNVGDKLQWRSGAFDRHLFVKTSNKNVNLTRWMTSNSNYFYLPICTELLKELGNRLRLQSLKPPTKRTSGTQINRRKCIKISEQCSFTRTTWKWEHVKTNNAMNDFALSYFSTQPATSRRHLVYVFSWSVGGANWVTGSLYLKTQTGWMSYFYSLIWLRI